jgi:acyl dehydratase
MLAEMGVPLGRILHGEQGFDYVVPVVAGDVVTVTSAVKDIYDKKGGALEFIEMQSEARNAAGDLVARMRSVTVVRH